tara:strand:- start:1125 stop:1706 length:582 start_codon:yes stop_codon:yes gene_type:complete
MGDDLSGRRLGRVGNVGLGLVESGGTIDVLLSGLMNEEGVESVGLTDDGCTRTLGAVSLGVAAFTCVVGRDGAGSAGCTGVVGAGRDGAGRDGAGRDGAGCGGIGGGDIFGGGNVIVSLVWVVDGGGGGGIVGGGGGGNPSFGSHLSNCCSVVVDGGEGAVAEGLVGGGGSGRCSWTGLSIEPKPGGRDGSVA